MTMKLNIEDIPLTLGERLDATRLESSPFHKEGLVKRLISRASDGRDHYVHENARLTCLTEEFTIFPCTHDYLDKDRRWETRASIFIQDGRLEEVLFQVIDGRYAAGNFLDRFTETCTDSLGEPVEHHERGTVWHNGTSILTAYLHDSRVDADFRFEWARRTSRANPSGSFSGRQDRQAHR